MIGKPERLGSIHIAELEVAITERFTQMLAEAEASGDKAGVAACIFTRDVQLAVARTMRDFPDPNLYDTGMRVAGGMAAGVAQLAAAANPEVRESAAFDLVAEIAASSLTLLRIMRENEKAGTVEEAGGISVDYKAKTH